MQTLIYTEKCTIHKNTDTCAYTLTTPVVFKIIYTLFPTIHTLTCNVISKANKYTATQASSHSPLMTLDKTKPIFLVKIPSCVLQVSFLSTCLSTITTPFSNRTFYVASKCEIRQYSRLLISNETSDKGVSVVAMGLGQ